MIQFQLFLASVALLLIANLATMPNARTDESEGPDRGPAVLGPATELPVPGENGLNYLDYSDERPAFEVAGEPLNFETPAEDIERPLQR